jgi:hypothetical protein
MADRPPKLRRQSGGAGRADMAFIEFRGRRYYLGSFDSSEAKRKYGLFLAAHADNPSTALLAIDVKTPEDLTINEMLLAYWEHAEKHYRKNGRPTTEIPNLKQTIAFLHRECGDDPAARFGPKKLMALRQKMVDSLDEDGERRRWSRNTINKRCNHIRRIFRWAVANELVAPGILQGLEAVDGLQKGRTNARETEGVGAVDPATVEATMPFLPPVVADIVRLQRLIGCRPTEICIMRPGDIDRSDPKLQINGVQIWVYRPEEHKTEHRGRLREIAIGPQAQMILRPYLDRPSVQFCFSPEESEAKRLTARHARRKTPLDRGNLPGRRNGRTRGAISTLEIFGEPSPESI